MQYKELVYKESRDTGKGWKTFGATVELCHGDVVDSCFDELYQLVVGKLGGVPMGGTPEKPTVVPATVPPVIPTKSVVNTDKEAKKKKADVEKKAAIAEALAAKKKEIAEKKKSTPYNREVELHKDTLSELLEEHLGENWYEQEGVVDKAKQFSEYCTKNKVDIFDAKGEVLPTFKENLAEAFKKSAKPKL